MTRKLIFVAFVLAMALTLIAARHQLTNAAPNMAPPPKHAPPLEEYAARLAPETGVMPDWHVIAGGGGKDVDLHEVTMVSPDEGWAVGVTGPSSYGVIMHYTNTMWSRVTVPTGTYSIYGVSMISPTEGWAVGYDAACSYGQCDTGLLMHYTADSGWQKTALPHPYPEYKWGGLNGIDIKGTTGWAVGWEIAPYGKRFLQYNGTSWTPMTAPLNASDVSVVGANDAWAVGGRQLAHFSGGSWSVMTATVPSYLELQGIHMLNATNGWAVGYVRYPPYQCVTLYYDRNNWSQVPCPPDARDALLSSVRMRNTNDVWAVGSGPFPESSGVILHYNGSMWSRVTLPDGTPRLDSVRLVGTNDGWAVGKGGAVLRLLNGNWTRVQGPRLAIGPLDSVSADEAWYGGNVGQLCQWKDGTIVTHASPEMVPLTALDMVSPTLGWVAAERSPSSSYGIYQYSGGGWTPCGTIRSMVNAISMVSPTEGWFATRRNGLIHYSSEVWQQQSIPDDDGAGSVSMLDANHGWAVGRTWGQSSCPKVYTYANGIWNTVAPALTITASWGVLKVIGISPDEAWVAGWSVLCANDQCPAQPQLHHYSGGAWISVPTPEWLAFYSISKVSATEWWAVGKRTPWEYAFLHYKDGTYTIVPSAGEDVQQVSMLPDGSGFAAGVGSLLWLHEYPYSVFLPIVMK